MAFQRYHVKAYNHGVSDPTDTPPKRPAAADDPRRDEHGRIKPGHSLNPTGRPKGASKFAAFIAEKTEDGTLMVEKAIAIMKDDTHRDQMRAVEFLTEYLVGKPPRTVGIAVQDMERLKAVADQVAELEGMEPEQYEAILRAHLGEK
jgi:hypothetical protein